MTLDTHQLNILEIMGLKRSHYHKSIDSTSSTDITIPIVDAFQQYDSPTITRVTKQFAKNIERLTEYIKENSDVLKTTNLSNYITTNVSDENGMNKIFVSAPCAMSSERTLDIQNCRDVRSNDMPQMIKIFMTKDFTQKSNIIIGITKPIKDSSGNIIESSKIVRYDLTETLSMHPDMMVLYEAEEGIEFKRADYADSEKLFIYIITNNDIRLFNVMDMINLNIGENQLTYSNIVDFKKAFHDDHKRYNDNLVIEDIKRRREILSLINEGRFDEFVDKYYKLGEFPENVLKPEYFSAPPNNPTNVFDVGIATGKYGTYLIHCFSCKPKNANEFEIDENENVLDSNGNPQKTGSLHIRCLDNKPVKDAFFYENNNEKYLVAINGWPTSFKDDLNYSLMDNKYKGTTVFKLNEGTAASRSYDVTNEVDNNPLLLAQITSNSVDVPSDGFIESKDTGIKLNINQVLDSNGINGAYVNGLSYVECDSFEGLPGFDGIGLKGFIIRYVGFNQTTKSEMTKYWFVELGDQKLCSPTKVYDRAEFNCLAEYKINNSLYYPETNTILLDINNVGLVEGVKESDKNNNVGFRFRIIKRFGTYEQLNAIYSMNRCFVCVGNTTLYFVISNGQYTELTIGTDLHTALSSIGYSSTYDSSNFFLIGENNENANVAQFALIELKYKINSQYYTDLITQNLSNLISSNMLSDTNAVASKIKEHINDMHNENSLITRLNSIINLLTGESIKQATDYSDNMHMSYVILNYPNKGDDFSYIETTDNSTDIYGRINSKTINSNPSLITTMKRNSNAIAYYDTVNDINGDLILSTNRLIYSSCKLSDKITKVIVNVPTTGTYYVDNILGWSGGSRTGSALVRKNLDDGYMQGQIENCTTHYQLILNKVYFDIKNILNVTAQIASAPLKVYSNTNEYDIRHYGMYDSPVVTPLNMNIISSSSYTYDISGMSNDEIILTFSIFGGDALQINILIENNN